MPATTVWASSSGAWVPRSEKGFRLPPPPGGGSEGHSPEREEGPHVQHRQQLCLRLGEGEPVAQCLERRDDHHLLGVGKVELDDRLPGEWAGRETGSL